MNMENNGYPAKHYDQPTKRYVQTMDLKSDDNEIIRRYREAHDKEHFWTEIGRCGHSRNGGLHSGHTPCDDC